MELIDQLNSYYKESIAATKDRREKWKKLWKYWSNKQKSPNAQYFTSEIKANYCSVITDVKLPVLVGNKPTVNFINRKDGSTEGAEKLSKIVGRYLWDYNDVPKVLRESLLDAMTLDVGYIKTYYDYNENAPYGEVVIESVDPFKLFIDPYAVDIDKARYVIYVDEIPMSVAKARYPKIKDLDSKTLDRELKKDDTEDEHNKPKTVVIKEYYVSGIEFDDKEINKLIRNYIKKTKQEILYAEAGITPTQIKNYQLTEEEVKEYIKDTLTERVKNGGLYITVVNDKEIVEMKPNPYNHNKTPYITFISKSIPHSHYGKGDIEDILPIQDALNEALSQVHDSAIKTSSPFWRADPLIGKENLRKIKKQINRPGTVVLVKPGMLEPIVQPNIPAYALRRIPELVSFIERISGATDVLQGRGDIRQRTALGVQVLSQAGTSRISTSIAFMESSLKKLAYKVASIVQQYYTEERTIAITGDSGSTGEVITIKPEELVGEYEVSVDSGAALPQDKMSRVETAVKMYQMGVIQKALLHLGNPQQIDETAANYVLDVVELPKRSELRKTKPVELGTPPVNNSNGAGQAEQTQPGPNIQQPTPQQQPNIPPETAEILATLQQLGLKPEELQQMIQAAKNIQ